MHPITVDDPAVNALPHNIQRRPGRSAELRGHTPPYMKDAPVAIDVHIVPSTEPPTACGECPVPVISPAVVNALFRLTGKRYRTLPLTSL
jgi:CO/xanthine dehydrogenase Mo-binding subunit